MDKLQALLITYKQRLNKLEVMILDVTMSKEQLIFVQAKYVELYWVIKDIESLLNG